MEHDSSPIEMTPAELLRRIESREEVHVLDVRAPFRLQNGRIDIVPDEWFHNIPGSELRTLDDPGRAGLRRDVPIAVVCGRGFDSVIIADHLNERGFRATSIAGGMLDWMALAVPRELEPPAGCDRFVQFDRVGKGALAYLVISAGEGFVVDPSRDTDPILAAAREAGARIVGVADTHVHADYISGGPALALKLGVPYYLHPRDAFYPYDGTPGAIAFEALSDGRKIPVGRASIEALHTPGHTEGSVSYRIADEAILTGDFIFIGSVGRPDLGGKTEEWTLVLWASLERARREWARDARIYPAHYQNGPERNLDRSVGRTFGEILLANEPLAMTDGARFAQWVRERAGSFPDAYRRMKAINIGLEDPNRAEMDELEAGRNQCALG